MIEPLCKDVEEGRESLDPLCRVVFERTGLDLSHYKEKFLRRRVDVRLRATGQRDLPAYVAHLRRERGEIDEFLLSLTIHVSSFYRNPSTYRAVEREVLPHLFDSPGGGTVRIWSVGCARGEEPFSLAILVCEHLGGFPAEGRVRIEATDVDERVLEEAKRGEYRPGQLRELPPGLAARYFTGPEGGLLVPEIRRMVRFHRSDVFVDPPVGEHDLIVCRNLLIYIEREPQEKVIARFHGALRRGGFLVLGRTEAVVESMRDCFDIVDNRERIYRKTAEPRRPAAGAGGGV